jgi:hypothetical protein
MDRRKTMFLAVLVMGVGLGPPAAGRAGEPPAKQPVTAARAAVALLALEECLAERWEDGDGPVFVEAGLLIPPGLDRAGRYRVEVVSEADLKTRFAGRKRAPSLARVRVLEAVEKGQTVYTVEISYAGVAVPGATGVPIGGGRDYKYTLEKGKATLVERGSVKY